MTNRKLFLPLLLTCAFRGIVASSAAPTNTVTLGATTFDLAAVRVLESPFRSAQELDGKYLLSLDPERLLVMFKVTAGLSSSAAPYGGWEKPGVELRGHSLGHYLSACSLMYAGTGDERFRKRTDEIIDELAKCQANMPAQGYHAGYLSAFPESLFDRVDAQKSVWAPWYTMHKIFAGLLDVHLHTGNPKALDVVNRLADWVKFRVDRLTPEQMQGSLKNEHGGMNEALANLYGVTKNPDHLRLAEAFNHQAVFEPLARGEDKLNGLHANTQIPKMTGAAREYELSGNETYRQIAQFFWERVAFSRSYALGGHSDNEHFFPVTEFVKHLSPVTAETCNTYNMLKLTEHIFTWQPSARTMDFYERGLYNQILASQDPEHGMFAYFISMKPGHFKTYSTPDDSFWCCVGTGMENHAKYGEMIYAQAPDALFVNLFIPSELKWKERGFTVTQTTKFPEQNSTKLVFQDGSPATFTLKIRQPAWAENISVNVNGQRTESKSDASGYVSILREWRDGDQVSVTLPMSLRGEPLPGNSNYVAFFYGPVLLAGRMGTEGLPENFQYARDQQDQIWVPTPTPPALVGEIQNISQSLKAVANQPLTFETRETSRPENFKLIPFYRLHHERYTVYWPVYSESDWKTEAARRAKIEAAEKKQAARVVDEVIAGNPQSDRDHQLQEEETTVGEYRGRKWRQASEGQSLTWTLKSIPGQPLVLRCTVWSGDLRHSAFEVFVNGTKVGECSTDPAAKNDFADLEFMIPASATLGKEMVVVKFQPKRQTTTARIFQCSILKPDSQAAGW